MKKIAYDSNKNVIHARLRYYRNLRGSRRSRWSQRCR